ncbi:MAG: cobalt-precorrin-5B (C1)-methyltransferase [Acidimicrobiaceae bacterium]|jgi:cobalt-precorrin-5B (C1)-methyltransferase|nr:cobalt-precorrin-5B (C1)-methyltransferase [Acidimicrobiaceae bacterium]
MTGETNEPELSPDVAERKTGLRTGWTTGTCASAAAKAAASGLVTGVVPAEVEVGLPKGARVSFPVVGAGRVRDDAHTVRAAVVKDAGDDPDCTDGAELTADVRWAPEGATTTTLEAGPGVGTITKPGLGLEVGAPAINPVPRRMILAALAEITGRPMVVSFSVPGGVEMTKRTSNERLGILGGISILGTTGIVRPFSTAAYRASVVQQVDVAAAQGERTMVLCTGSRSETAAQRIYATLDPVSFVEVGDFSGIALRRCAADGMTQVNVVAMAGKITKLAAGVMMTHFHRSKVDTDLLAAVAAATGAPAAVVAAATETATARHFYDACLAAGTRAPLDRLCQLARDNCVVHGGGAFDCEVVMVDFEGDEVIARA